MNAPDKIFVNVDQFGFMHAYDIENHPSCGEEYIRKDALLEWAKERREAVAKEVVIQEGVRLGADAAFEELIEKIESL